LYYLTWRDIKIRYKQTILGALWAIIQPVMTMVVFTIIFGNFAGIPSDGENYAAFSFVALVPWTFFATALARAATIMESSAEMIKKVYFPRIVLPTAGTLAPLVDFVLAFGVMLVLLVVFQATPTIGVLLLPFFLLLAVLTVLGLGYWLAALNVLFRDVRFAVPFAVQMLLWVTPIAYPTSIIPERWLPLYMLNPMASVVDGFRWALLGTDTFPGSWLIVATGVALVLFISGAFFFRRMEKIFADVV
ncbi:MAG: ABC transporter permease, partial [Chloroflexota bacterium]